MTAEKFSTVPFHYRALLALDEVFEPGKRSTHSMHIAGSVHPEPYTHEAAVELVQQKLSPFTSDGWQIASLVVNKYGTSRDA